MAGTKATTRRSKWVSDYEAYLQDGITPKWHDFFSLPVDSLWLSDSLNSLPPHSCLGLYRPRITELFNQSIARLHPPSNWNAIQTLLLLLRSLLRKHFAGWELMQLLAGTVQSSDSFFNRFCSSLLLIIDSDQEKDAHRYRAIELGLVFMCSIDQLSPGAYFLRYSFLHASSRFITQTSTPSYPHVFLFLSALANYHRTDAAKLNPLPAQFATLDDQALLHKALSFYSSDAQKVVSSYQSVMDDRPTTLYTTLSTFLGQLKPDKVLLPSPIQPTTTQFAEMPPPEAVFLISMYDMLVYNPWFILACTNADPTQTFSPLISSFSYLMTHAWSSVSKRASSYARIALNILLKLTEHSQTFEMMCSLTTTVHICQQRKPTIPPISRPRLLISALLDCAVLYLRHNLHRDLDVWAYSACLSIIHKAVSTLARTKKRLDYHWHELWKSLLATLQFLAVKTDEGHLLQRQKLLRQLLAVISRALISWEGSLQKVESVSQLLFEIMRAQPLFTVLPRSVSNQKQVGSLVDFVTVAEYYNEKVHSGKKIRTGEEVIDEITRIVDREGVYGVLGEGVPLEDEEIERPTNIHAHMGFSRLLYIDGIYNVN